MHVRGYPKPAFRDCSFAYKCNCATKNYLLPNLGDIVTNVIIDSLTGFARLRLAIRKQRSFAKVIDLVATEGARFVRDRFSEKSGGMRNISCQFPKELVSTDKVRLAVEFDHRRARATAN